MFGLMGPAGADDRVICAVPALWAIAHSAWRAAETAATIEAISSAHMRNGNFDRRAMGVLFNPMTWELV
jgi:hypothetical protein